MTSEEQARAIAKQVDDAIGTFDSFHEEDVHFQNVIVPILLSALRTREAETWEQAAQEVESFPATWLHTLRFQEAAVKALRARAAQLQEPTTKVGDR